MVSTHLSLRLVGLFPTPAILVLHIENQAPCLFLKVQVIFYLSEAYIFLNHAVHGVRNMGNTSDTSVLLLLSSGMSCFFLLLSYSWRAMLRMLPTLVK
jgi:hypothetical protein